MAPPALIEFLTEELPPGFLASLPKTLPSIWEQHLKDAHLLAPEATLSAGDLTLWLTPRRIAVLLPNLPKETPAQTLTHKGPPVRIAYDDAGQPTRAAEAFANKCNVPVSELTQETLGNETYLTYHQHIAGRPTPAVLADVIPHVVESLQGPRFMRWGNYDLRFPRPIHGIVALWGNEVIPAKIHHLAAGRTTHGHRLYAHQALEISSASEYAVTLRNQGHVWVDALERRQAIINALDTAAQQTGGRWIPNPDLLDEVVAITEAPWVFTGRFEEAYLDLPKPVIVTVLASHQRYFSVEDANGQLLPVFLGVSNGKPEAVETIVAGNERVLRARLNDARFFLDADMAKPLTERVDDLSGITFQKGLASLAEKTHRLQQLAPQIAQDLDIPVTDDLKTAAQLAKTDLTTQMVFEFTELEGDIGAEYARRQGMSDAVATALKEQYQPRFQGDDLPQTPIGKALSVADKLDTLVCVLSQPKVSMPTGSRDPMGLRRMANGLLLILMTDGTPTIHFKTWVEAAYTRAPLEKKVDWEVLWTERLTPFITQRLRSLLQEEGLPGDVMAAVLAEEAEAIPSPFDRLPLLHHHAAQLQILSETTLAAILEPANRIQRIVGKKHTPLYGISTIQPQQFETDEEHAVHQALADYWQTYPATAWQLATPAQANAMATWQPLIAALFDAVMVNAEDDKVRANRYALLSSTLTAYQQLGDLSALSIEKASTPTVPVFATTASHKE